MTVYKGNEVEFTVDGKRIDAASVTYDNGQDLRAVTYQDIVDASRKFEQTVVDSFLSPKQAPDVRPGERWRHASWPLALLAVARSVERGVVTWEAPGAAIQKTLARHLTAENGWSRVDAGTDRRRSVPFEVGQVLDIPAGRMTVREERVLVVSTNTHVVTVQRSDGWRHGFAASSVCAEEARLVGYQLPDGRRVLVGDGFRHCSWDASVPAKSLREVLPGGCGSCGGAPFLLSATKDRGDGGRLDDWNGWERVTGATFEQPRAVVHKVEIAVSASAKAGEVARQVGEYLAKSSRFRTNTPAGDRPNPEQIKQAGRVLDEVVATHRRSTYPDRSEIDALLREDARLHPEFARARMAAVMADLEVPEKDGTKPVRGARSVELLLRELHRYEAARGGGRRPSPEVARMADKDLALAAYERARSAT